MIQWCFKCGKGFDAAETTCPTCGSKFAEVHAGDRRTPVEPPIPHHAEYMSELELIAWLSKKYGVPSIDLDDFEIEAEVIAMLPAELTFERRVIPVNLAGSSIVIAMADPSDIFAIDEVRKTTKLNVEVAVCAKDALARALARYYPGTQ